MKLKRGVCRYCHCTEDRACRVPLKSSRSRVVIAHLQAAQQAGKPVHSAWVPCSWADDLQTVCSNPRCLRKWRKDLRRKIEARKRRRARIVARARKRRRA